MLSAFDERGQEAHFPARRLALRPQAWSLGLCLAAWTYMYLGDFTGSGSLGVICTSSRNAARYGAQFSGQWALASLSHGGAVGWGIMAALMMTPLALGPARRLAAVGAGQPRRAAANFLFGFGVIWLLAGILAHVLAFGAVAVAPPAAAPACAFLLALAWELTPAKRRTLHACRMDAEAPRPGAGASPGEALRYGVRQGLNCLASCGAMMFAAASVEQRHLAAMAAIAAICLVQRIWPQFALRAGAAGLAGLAVAYAVPAVVS